MVNPTLFDSRLSRLENQLRGRLQRVTHAIQAAMHQRFAIDYLNPAELVQLYDQLAGQADEEGCELLIQYHSDLFQVETPFSSTDRMGISSSTCPWHRRERCFDCSGSIPFHCRCLTPTI
jgi:hypothetical protein